MRSLARIVGATLALVGAACTAGSDDAADVMGTTSESSEPSSGASSEAPGAGTGSMPQPATSSVTPTSPPIADGPLAEVCPARIVIQTEDLPAPDVGPLYRLLGPEPTIDAGTASAAAPLVRPDGTAEDVVLEIRSGGPAVGFLTPLELLGADTSVLLAQSSTAVALRDASSVPGVGVVTLTDRSREAIIVDPATFPDVDSVEAVRDAGIEVRTTTGAPFAAFLVANGALDAEQVVGGFDGEPAAFVESAGLIAQQGDLLVEPVLIPSLPQWNRPVTAIDAASAGWDDYDDALFARSDEVDERRGCLGRLVPIVQQAVGAYLADPGPTDAVMAVASAQFTPLPRLDADLMDAGVAVGVEAGVFGDGDDETVGNFDLDRLAPFLAELAEVLDVQTIDADELVTNEFIDPDLTSAG